MSPKRIPTAVTSHSLNPAPRTLWDPSPLHNCLTFHVSSSKHFCLQLPGSAPASCHSKETLENTLWVWLSEVNIVFLSGTTLKEMSPAFSGPVHRIVGVSQNPWECPSIGGQGPITLSVGYQPSVGAFQDSGEALSRVPLAEWRV